MKAKLTLNGKEYEVELTEEQVTEIENTNKPKTGFEYGGFGMEWYVSELLADTEEPILTNADLCKDYARVVNLFLKLSKWQALNDTVVSNNGWYEICYNDYKGITVLSSSAPSIPMIKFSSEEKACKAIDQFKEELTWYFTEFRPRLDML